jgi:hypothetical protein
MKKKGDNESGGEEDEEKTFMTNGQHNNEQE